jgi:PIN domain nuclease of toxin-antitoxin system
VKILLDPNAFIRLMTADGLPGKVELLLEKAGTDVFVSIVTAWEIVMKPKLEMSAGDVEAGIAAMAATVLPLRFRHTDELSGLPAQGDHRDPFDRMLIAQALAGDLSMVSSDTRFEEHKRLRVIWN